MQILTKKNQLGVKVTERSRKKKNKEHRKTSASLACGEGVERRKREDPLCLLDDLLSEVCVLLTAEMLSTEESNLTAS